MRTVTLEELLEAGCHFGHQVSRQNSKAREYIFEARDNIHIIDLEKTKEGLEDAGKFVKDIAQRGGTLLILGTKRQAIEVLDEELKRVKDGGSEGLYYVTRRWIGGTLTNLSEVSKNFNKLKDLGKKLQSEHERVKYTKKELNDWDKERQKLQGFYGGVVEMTKVPDAVFIIDTHMERVAAEESLKAGVPTVGITDTNADPTIINYPIPANDDAVGSLKLIVSYIFDAWLEGKKKAREQTEEPASTSNAAQAKASGKKVLSSESGEEKKPKEVKNEKKQEVKEEKESQDVPSREVKTAVKKEITDTKKEKPAKKTSPKTAKVKQAKKP